MRRVPGVVLLTVFALLPAIPSGQQQPRFKAAVEAVVLDASVLDKDGMPVRGLTKADFILFEDGQPQAITAFTAIDLPDVEHRGPTVFPDAPRDVRSNDEVKEGTIWVIVLDDAVTGGPAMLRGRQYAHQVLERLGPTDIAAVVFVVNKRAGQEFTRDRSRLAAAIDRYRMGGGAIDELAPRMVTDTLRSVVEGLAEIPQRRKAIVFVSEGLAFDFAKAAPQGLEWQKLIDTMEAGSTIANLVDFFDVARRANVSVYCIDPSELKVGSGPHLKSEFLQTLSQNTGGFTVTQTNDPRPGIVQMYRENASYYILGHVSSNERREGRFRRIEVKVNRPGVTVRTRQGYFEPRPVKVDAAKPAPDALPAAMTGFFPKADVPMQMTAAPFALPGRPEAAVLLVLGVGAVKTEDATAWEAPATVDDIEVLAGAYNMLGDLRASERFHARPDARRDEAGGVVRQVVSRLVLRPGAYHVRVAAGTAGRTGSVHYDVTVPDFAGAQLALSGLLLGDATAKLSVPAADLQVTLPIAPTVRRVFRPADDVVAFVRVYQGGSRALGPVTMTARITNENGREVFGSNTQLDAARFGTSRAADYQAALPLTTLAPGQYLLTVEAKMGKRTERRTALFAIVR